MISIATVDIFSGKVLVLISALAIALPLVLLAILAFKLAWYARRVKRQVEAETLIGRIGRAESEITSASGLVFVRGELWHALALKPIARGTSVCVTGFRQLA